MDLLAQPYGRSRFAENLRSLEDRSQLGLAQERYAALTLSSVRRRNRSRSASSGFMVGLLGR
jgi:hypothetical protein